MCEEDEQYDEEYEPDCMDISKEHDIQMSSYVCEVCLTDLHHNDEKGWYCPHGHANPVLKCRRDMVI